MNSENNDLKMCVIVQGKTCNVDLSALTEDEIGELRCVNTVSLIEEDFNLQDGFLLTVQKLISFTQPKEYEFVAEKFFYHEPTKNEIMQFMAKHEVFRFGVASVQKAYEWEFNGED